MKIGLVLSKTPSYSETFFMSKIKGLQTHGHMVTLFVQKRETSFSLCDVKVAPRVYRNNIFLQILTFFTTSIRLLRYPKRIRLFIKLERLAHRPWKQIFKNMYSNGHILSAKLDWLHFGFATMAIQSEHVAQAIGAKMAVSLRGFDIAIYPQNHIRCYDNLWKMVDKLHTISDDLYLLAIKNGLSSKTPFQKITPAIDVKMFKSALEHNEKTIHDKLNFLTVGRLHWKKGFMDTLEALALLKHKGVNFSYTIVGEGHEFEALSFAIHQLQLSENINLMGKRNQVEIAELMNLCDIYLQYSISEGFCNAVLEAQAMGCLCVVSDAEGLAENVLHNETGWVVPKRNPKLLSNIILEVIHLPEQVKLKTRVNARERVIRYFNLEKQQNEFIDFYNFNSKKNDN